MICHRQIIVDGLRDTHESLRLVVSCSIIREHFHSVHRIVSAVIQEVLNIIFLEDGEDLLVYILIAFNFRQFVAA